MILAGSNILSFCCLCGQRFTGAGGAALFGFPLREANWPGAILILAASVLAFLGLAILSANYLLVFKQGNPVNWAVLGISSVAGGMMYPPVSVLFTWLQHLARLVPMTYSLEGIRAPILGHSSMREL